MKDYLLFAVLLGLFMLTGLDTVEDASVNASVKAEAIEETQNKLSPPYERRHVYNYEGL